MLTRLRQLHGEMFDALADSEAISSGRVPDRETLARVRWNLTRAGINLRRFQEEEVFPLLFRRLGGEKAADVRDVRETAVQLRTIAGAHITLWPIDRVACEWEGYAEDAAALRRAIRGQVAAEQASLYPLLAAHAEAAAEPPRARVA